MKSNYRSTAESFALHILIFIAAIVFFVMAGCTYSSKVNKRMDRAEMLMENHPDSALSIIDSISQAELQGRKQKARYALLKSIALDKNYIDTTTFDVLQPAIDYYLKHGSPDEKLRTYYYQGRIHQNANNEDLAMLTWLRGNEVEGVSDSLILAHILVAEGILYYKQYKISNFVECNLRAAKIYGSLGKQKMQIKSYSHAINGALILKEKSTADSILQICRYLTERDSVLSEFINGKILNYIIEYGDKSEIKKALNNFNPINLSTKLKLELAKGYCKIGDSEMALQYLNAVNINSDYLEESLSYLTIRSDISENRGDFKKAKESMTAYALLLSKSNCSLFTNELLFAEKKHEMEMSILLERQQRWNIIWAAMSCGLILVIVLIIALFKNRLTASQKKLAEQELENLRLELGMLEDERERLEGLLKERPDLTPEMMNVIYQRLDMLNSLLAKEITSNDSYARPLIDSIRKDRSGFLDSTRLAFSISHPEFMNYLKDHDLSEEEINYVCLYAMGLRGKEIGEYIQLKRHYVMGSGIRKKLGIDEHETNLGPYIRKLLKEL